MQLKLLLKADCKKTPSLLETAGRSAGNGQIMPTATEVDNRAVAVHRYPPLEDDRKSGGGKWSRHKYGGRQSPASILLRSTDEDMETLELDDHTGRNCGAGNCVHKIGNICTDILLQPELYLDLFSNKGVTSTNPLLEFCLDGGYQWLANKNRNEDSKELSHILALCSNVDSLVLMPNAMTCLDSTAYNSNPYGQVSLNESDQNPGNHKMGNEGSVFLDHLRQLCQEGCDINVQGSQGYSALHFLINGCSRENLSLTCQAVTLLLSHGIDVNLEDLRGNTCLLPISNLLDKELYQESFELAKLLLESSRHQDLVNHANHAGRTLLSHSVCHGDLSSDLTRLLINHGAKVLPYLASDYRQEELNKERNSSSFVWFLKNLMRSQSLDNTEKTVGLLSQAMHQELEPSSQMKTYIVSTMLHIGKCSKSVGPLFLQLKQSMSAFWRQPQTLRYLCLKSIRKSIGPKNLFQGTEQLNLPKPLTSYLQLN